MAYAFSQIDELLKGQDQNQQTNIFGGSSGQPQQPGQMQMGQQPKTVAEGPGSTAASNPNAGATRPAGTVYDTGTGERAAFDANRGKTQEPKALQDVSSQLTAKNQQLQNEANSYVAAGREKQNYAVDTGTLENAVRANKDNTAFSNVMGLLNRQNINQADEFQAPDVRVKDIDQLRTPEGIKSLVSRGMDPNYSSGMAAFDVRALQGTPGFGDKINSLSQRQQDLQKAADERGATARTEIENYGKSQLAKAQQDAKQYLQNQAAALRADNEQEAAAYNAALGNLNTETLGADALQKALANVRADVGQIKPLATRFIDPTGIKAAEYVTRGQNRAAGDFVSADEAARFNNILSLLGGGEQSWTPSQPVTEASQNYTVNQTDLENRLKGDALAGYGRFEEQSNASINDIIKAAQGSADAEDTRMLQLLDSQRAPDWLKAEAAKAYEGATLGDSLKQYYSADMLDPGKYLMDTPNIDLGWSDVLAQTDADKLNELARGIGLPGSYQKGSYAAGNPYLFDKTSYMNDLVSTLNQRKREAEAAQVAAAEQAAREATYNASKTQTGKLDITRNPAFDNIQIQDPNTIPKSQLAAPEIRQFYTR